MLSSNAHVLTQKSSPVTIVVTLVVILGCLYIFHKTERTFLHLNTSLSPHALTWLFASITCKRRKTLTTAPRYTTSRVCCFKDYSGPLVTCWSQGLNPVWTKGQKPSALSVWSSQLPTGTQFDIIWCSFNVWTVSFSILGAYSSWTYHMTGVISVLLLILSTS